MTKHMTLLVFLAAAILSVVSIGLVFLQGNWFLILLLVSVAANLAAVRVSEKGGFVRTNQMRRAHEPPRHFNAAQTLSLMGLVVVQVILGAYSLLV